MNVVSTKCFASLGIAVTMMLTGGCASIMAGDSQTVTFTSTPDGAMLEIIKKDGEVIHRAQAPTTVQLKRGAGFFTAQTLTVRASYAGYPDKEMPVEVSLNPWYLGNIIFGGLPGMLIVDPLTGAMFQFPETVHVDLSETATGVLGRRELDSD